MDNKEKCCICSQINGEKENDLISILLKENESEYKRRIAFENEHFVVIPSLGALVQGHLLICPKSHYRSIAQIDKNLDADYLEILRLTIAFLNNHYNTGVHLFEHGSAKNSNKIICTVDHAHLHLIPSNVSIEQILFMKYNWIEIGDSLEEFRSVVGNDEYIYYQSPLGKKFIAHNSINGFESQYMRQVFNQAIHGHNNWDWKVDPDPFEADKTFYQIKQHFNEIPLSN